MRTKLLFAWLGSLAVAGCGYEPRDRPGELASLTVEDAVLAMRVAGDVVALRARDAEIRIETEGPVRDVRQRGNSVEIERDECVERIEWRDGSIAQSWAFEHQPRSEVRVRVRVEGAQRASIDARGVLLHEPGARTGFRYGHGTWIDADGVRTAVPATISEGAIELHVPAAVVARSRFPAVLDPVIGPEIIADDDPGSVRIVGGEGHRVVWTGARYLATWKEGLPVIGNVIAPDGTIDPPIARTISDGDVYVLGAASLASNGTVTVAAWADDHYGVWIARLDAMGNRLGPPISIGTLGRDLSVATDGSTFAVVWISSDGRTIHGLRLAADGTPLDAAPRTLLSLESADSCLEVNIASAGSRWVLALVQRNGTGNALRVRSIAADLSGPPSEATTIATAADRELSLEGAVRGGSEVAIAYRSGWSAAVRIVSTDGSAASESIWFGSFVRAFGIAHDGRSWLAGYDTDLGRFEVSRFSSSGVISSASTGRAGDQIACSPTECIAIAAGYEQGRPRLSGIRFGRDLATIGTEIDVGQAAVPQMAPAIATDGTTALIAWAERTSEMNWDVRGARVDAIGRVLDATPLAIAAAADDYETHPAVGAGGGAFLVGWWEWDPTARQSWLRARRVTPDGSMAPSAVMVAGPSSEGGYLPAIAWTGDHFLVAWGTETGAWYRRVAADGTPIGTSAVLDEGLRATRVSLSVATDRSTLLAYATEHDVRGAILSRSGSIETSLSIVSGSGVAAAWDGEHHVVAWSRYTPGGAHDVLATRITPRGQVLDVDGIVIAPAARNSALVAASNGEAVLVGYGRTTDSAYAPRQRLAGVVLDRALAPSAPFALTPDPVEHSGWSGFYPEVSLAGAGGRWAVAYSRFDPQGASVRARARFIAPGGIACSAASDCAFGHCVDGVCCDEECGGGAADCMACSVAAGGATDGKCGPLAGSIASSIVCRAARAACDTVEFCSGASRECPGDTFASADVVCRPAAGPCDALERCTGGDPECPLDLAQSDGTPCANRLVCDGAETCASGVCEAGDALGCDDHDVCTADACEEPAGCAHAPIEGCCHNATECDDSDACTADACEADRCAHAAIEGCCTSDADCSDASACTRDRCVDASCVHESDPSCDADAGAPIDAAIPIDAAVPADAAPELDGAPDDRDASTRDGGMAGEAPEGCGCRVGHRGTPGWLALVVVALAARSRRRRRAARQGRNL